MSLISTKLPKAMAVACAPGITSGLWAEILEPFVWQWGINSVRKIAAFVGQVSIESQGFSVLEDEWTDGLIRRPGLMFQSRFAAHCRIPSTKIGAYLRSPKGAAEGACWAWSQVFDLNPAAEGWFLTSISRRIAGGLDDLQQRLDMCNRVLAAIK